MNLLIALPNDRELAESLGKKGSENGITFYNRKLEDRNITLLTPSNISDKYYSLPQSLLLSELVLLSTKSIDSLFADVVACCELLGKKLILTKDNDIGNILKGLSVNYENIDKSNMLEYLGSCEKIPENGKTTKIILDRAFPVKGVGDIALGIITEGKVHVHDNLFHSSGKGVTIKHIQVNDIDVESSESGTRVGLAIKGLDYNEIKKGDVLSTNIIKPTSSAEVSITVSKFAKEVDLEGEKIEAAGYFTYSSVKLSHVKDNTYRLELAKKLPLSMGDRLIFVKSKSPRMFAVGVITKIE